MKFSVCLECSSALKPFTELVRLIDDTGFHQLWLTDLGLKSFDVFPYLTLALTHSQRLAIGAAVHPPQLRHPAVTSNTVMTLNELGQGRMLYGIGTGDPTILGPVGHRPLKLAALRELVSRSRELLSGKRVSSDTDELLMAEAGLGRATGAHIPIYIAATGPKTLALAGEVDEGVIAHVGASPATLQHARQSAAPALRKDFDFNPYLYLCLAETRENQTVR